MNADERSFFIMEIVTILLVAISSFLLLTELFPLTTMFDIQLVLYLTILVLDYLRVKSFTFFQIWIVGFIFIVWSEMRITSSGYLGALYTIPYVRFSLANFLLLLGYHTCQNKKIIFHNKVCDISKTNWLFTFIIIILYLIYVSQSARSAIVNLQYGRQLSSAKGSSTLTGALISALGTILPAIIAYHVKYVKGKNSVISFVYSLPIFIILLLQSTRFRFLFSVMPFLIVVGVLNFGKADRKKNVILLICVILMVSVSSFVKSNRNMAFAEIENPSLFDKETTNRTDPLTLKIAKQMSPEGILRMAYYADEYFLDHPLHYGKEMSFIFYFWVPRSIWPNKPTQLDYWLIRECSSEVVADSYSSASGFIGEARADFGWGCLLLAFFLGVLFKKIDDYKDIIWTYYRQSFNIVLIAILVPWAFFFVRSPLTSTMSLIWELILYYLFVRFFSTPFPTN